MNAKEAISALLNGDAIVVKNSGRKYRLSRTGSIVVLANGSWCNSDILLNHVERAERMNEYSFSEAISMMTAGKVMSPIGSEKEYSFRDDHFLESSDGVNWMTASFQENGIEGNWKRVR